MKRKNLKLKRERLENMLINIIGEEITIVNIIPLDDGIYVRYSDNYEEFVDTIVSYETLVEFYRIQLTAEALYRKLNP